MTEHDLKTWPEYFQAIVEGRKPFEYRLNDRDYQVGDVLHLREFIPPTPDHMEGAPLDVDSEEYEAFMAQFYTGRALRKSVTYILDDKLGPTMREGFVVMGISDTETTAPPSLTDARNARQKSVYEWAVAAFGQDHCVSIQQRGLRFLEEAIELYQAARGERYLAHKLVDYIFDRPAGAVTQEFGGVGITLLCLAEALKVSADGCEQSEFERVRSKPLSHFHARNEVKNQAGFNVIEPTI